MVSIVVAVDVVVTVTGVAKAAAIDDAADESLVKFIPFQKNIYYYQHLKHDKRIIYLLVLLVQQLNHYSVF